MPKEKDGAERELESHNDVFADISNNALFGGKRIIKPEDLEDALTASQLKAGKALHQQERDVLKRWRNCTVVIAAIGHENQTKPDFYMPIRVVCYDAGEYRHQLLSIEAARRQGEPVPAPYPVITIVLYYGTRPWRGPKTLRACFRDVPPELEPYLPDYPIHVVDLAGLTPEQVAGFQSDFRYVVDYLVQARAGKGYTPPEGEIIHVDETLKLMAAVTGSEMFQTALENYHAEGKEKVTMAWLDEQYLEAGRKQVKEEYEALLSDRDRALADSRRELADKDRRLEETERELRELKLRFGLA